jgi:hypothetical protein
LNVINQTAENFKQELTYSPEVGLHAMRQALKCHLACYTKHIQDGSFRADKSEEYARNTALHLFSFVSNHGRYDELAGIVAFLVDERSNVRCDPLEDAIIAAMTLAQRQRGSKPDLYKAKARIEQLKKEIEKNSEWYDQSAKNRALDSISRALERLSGLTKSA